MVKQFVLIAPVVYLVLTATLDAQEIDGFIEPYHARDLSPGEPGLIASVDVKEGQSVRANQVLGSLDTAVLEASLEVASEHARARGELEAAEAELQLRLARSRTIQRLRESGNATQEELDQSAADVAIAKGQVRASQEAIQIRQLEVRRIQQSIQHKSIRSPIDGVVTRVYKRAGEYASPTDPVVFRVVQLSRVRVIFSVPISVADRLRVGQMVAVETMPETASGTVEHISPVIEPESGTVRMRVRIDNSNSRFRVGSRCSLKL